MTGPAAPQSRWWQRLGWLVLIWAASVAALAVVALGFRVLMRLAGMAS